MMMMIIIITILMIMSDDVDVVVDDDDDDDNDDDVERTRTGPYAVRSALEHQVNHRAMFFFFIKPRFQLVRRSRANRRGQDMRCLAPKLPLVQAWDTVCNLSIHHPSFRH
jgi:hypothetical protein